MRKIVLGMFILVPNICFAWTISEHDKAAIYHGLCGDIENRDYQLYCLSKRDHDINWCNQIEDPNDREDCRYQQIIYRK